MTLHQIIRSIDQWWWKRQVSARLDPKAKERRQAILKAQRQHRPTRPLLSAQKAHTHARLRQEVGHG